MNYSLLFNNWHILTIIVTDTSRIVGFKMLSLKRSGCKALYEDYFSFFKHLALTVFVAELRAEEIGNPLGGFFFSFIWSNDLSFDFIYQINFALLKHK